MAQTQLSGIKGSTKDIIIALFKSANKDIEGKDLYKEALLDINVAHGGRAMIQSSGKLEAYQATLESSIKNAPKNSISDEFKKECEKLKTEIAECVKSRESLEKQFFEYAFRAKKNPEDLTAEMEKVKKLASSLELKAINVIERLVPHLPPQAVAEIRKNQTENESRRLEK